MFNCMLVMVYKSITCFLLYDSPCAPYPTPLWRCTSNSLPHLIPLLLLLLLFFKFNFCTMSISCILMEWGRIQGMGRGWGWKWCSGYHSTWRVNAVELRKSGSCEDVLVKIVIIGREIHFSLHVHWVWLSDEYTLKDVRERRQSTDLHREVCTLI